MMDKNDNFALVPRPPGALEKAEPGARRILSGMVADTLALAKKGARPRPSFIALLGHEFFARIFEAVIRRELPEQYELKVYHFDRASELLKLAEEHGFDLVAMYLGNIMWNVGPGKAYYDAAVVLVPGFQPTAVIMPWFVEVVLSVLAPLYSRYGNPIFVTQAMDLAQEFEGTGITFAEAPFPIEAFRAVVKGRLAVLEARAASRARIVLVDDDSAFLSHLKELTQSLFVKATVVAFADPTEAVEALARSDPDVLVTNWTMPRINGEMVLRALAERKAQFPVIVTSGRLFSVDEVRQCADPSLNVTFLRKPFTAARFAEVLEVALGIPPVEQPTTEVTLHASLEDVESLCRRGEAYYYGEEMPKNDVEAAKWFRVAAERGCTRAQCWLGYFYTCGRGLPEDRKEAARWYGKPGAARWLRKAAESQDPTAQLSLGCRYEFGHGVRQNHAEAVKWYRRAAEQGYPPAQVNLGNCYLDGRGVPVDHTKALDWYRKAAEQGHATAQCNLGLCYECGHGVPQDYAEALKWYQKAVEQGDKWAQYNLGRCYRNGIGVPSQASDEAAKWLQKSADQGHKAAQLLLAALSEK